jgi:hypothetical protein
VQGSADLVTEHRERLRNRDAVLAARESVPC